MNPKAAIETISRKFYALSTKIRELISPSPTLRTSIFSPSSSSIQIDSDRSTHIRLPKLNLPTFFGKYDEWFPFFDTFNSVIHSNTSLSNTQRFQYLRASLTGDANYAVISSLELSDTNYDVINSQEAIWQQARDCSNSRQGFIMDLSTMTKENIIDLRRISDSPRNICTPFRHWSVPWCIVMIFSSSF